MSNQQIKSKKRVADHGEVFTNPREVNAMLDLVADECQRIESRFLEPACGTGNFLVEILNRKLQEVSRRYRQSQIEYERYAIIALSSIYGVDILADNVAACRQRLFEVFDQQYTALFKDKCKPECRRSVRYLLTQNILWGDALTLKTPEVAGQASHFLVFSEWSAVNGSLIKRRDYEFQYLVEKSHQYSLFDDLGKPSSIDKPVGDYPPMHFLKLGETDDD